MLRILAALALACLSLAGATAPLHAALPGLSGEQSAEPAASGAEPSGALDDRRDPASDQRIAERLSGIYGQVDEFSDIDVSVSEGVVRLTGSAPTQDAIDRAGAIASRFDVVTVQNDVARDTSLSNTADIVTALFDRLREAGKMLPVIGVAALIGLAILLVGYLIASLKFVWRIFTPNSFLADLVASAIRFASIIFALVIALDIIGATALLGAVLGGAGVIGIALGFAVAALGFGLFRPGFTSGMSLAVSRPEQGQVSGKVASVNGASYIYAPALGVWLYGHSDWIGFAAIIGFCVAVMVIGWTRLDSDEALMARADD